MHMHMHINLAPSIKFKYHHNSTISMAKQKKPNPALFWALIAIVSSLFILFLTPILTGELAKSDSKGLGTKTTTSTKIKPAPITPVSMQMYPGNATIEIKGAKFYEIIVTYSDGSEKSIRADKLNWGPNKSKIVKMAAGKAMGKQPGTEKIWVSCKTNQKKICGKLTASAIVEVK